LYTAPDLELSIMRIAWVPSTELFQPETVPFSVQKRKEAAFPAATLNDDALELKSTPVTAPGLLDPVGPGIETTRAIAVPVPS
jgi:hypothetical protein